ncbi:MAG: response regulator [Erythrobacter sp.]|nr:MAG: response regulator [Erythrobacter sp.]
MMMKVLIVEDEALTAMAMEEVLVDHGYEVVAIADDQVSAMKAAEVHSPDFAFVDINLAGGDSGILLAAQFKPLGIVVVFATGTCPGDEFNDVALGCIHKPTSKISLVSAARFVEASISSLPLPRPPQGMHLY